MKLHQVLHSVSNPCNLIYGCVGIKMYYSWVNNMNGQIHFKAKESRNRHQSCDFYVRYFLMLRRRKHLFLQNPVQITPRSLHLCI